VALTKEDFHCASIEEAEEKKLTLISEIREIETQLGNPLKENEYEKEDDFLRWRQNAKWALTLRLEQLRFVKLWIKEHNAELQ